MARQKKTGGGFLWGVLLGGLAGFLLGSYLATEEGRKTVVELRRRAEELASDPELRERAQTAFGAARYSLGDAVREGVTAARERREELSPDAAPAPVAAAEEHRHG